MRGPAQLGHGRARAQLNATGARRRRVARHARAAGRPDGLRRRRDAVVHGRQAGVHGDARRSGRARPSSTDRLGLAQVGDVTSSARSSTRCSPANPAEVEAFRGGKQQLIGFFTGQVMRASGGQRRSEGRPEPPARPAGRVTDLLLTPARPRSRRRSWRPRRCRCRTTARPSSRLVLARVLDGSEAGLPHRARRDPVQLERHRRVRVGLREPASRRATDPRRLGRNFGERWVKMAEAYRADVEVLRSPWGSRPDPEAVAAR